MLSPENPQNPLVGIVMGSESDYLVMSAASEILNSFGINYEIEVSSAHRDPFRTIEFAKTAQARGLRALIAGAGGAAQLPGVLAAVTPLPVAAVAISTPELPGKHALDSMIGMPAGVPVAVLGIDKSGAVNSALYIVRWLSLLDLRLGKLLIEYNQGLSEKSRDQNARVKLLDQEQRSKFRKQ